jgi:hypothetical protein
VIPLSLSDENIQRGTVSNVAKDPASLLGIVDKDEDRLTSPDRSPLTQDDVQNQRGECDSD